MKKFILYVLILISSISEMQSAIPIDLAKKYVTKEISKINKYSAIRIRNQAKYLDHFNKKQAKLFKRLCKTDPLMSVVLYYSWNASMQRLNRSLNNDKIAFSTPTRIINLSNDSLMLSVDYLLNDSANSSTQAYKNQLNNEQLVYEYMREQKSIMKNVIKEVPELKNIYKDICKDEYYFVQQNLEYDNLFSLKNKFEKSVLLELKSDNQFKNIINNFSSISSISKLPESWGKTIEDLQTNASIAELQKLQFKNYDSASIAGIFSNIMDGNKMMFDLKAKGMTTCDDLPEFKPNPMKTKRFIDRFNYGYDFQFVNAGSKMFSTNFSCGLSLKYNFTSIISIGSGFSYLFDIIKYKNEIRNFNEKVNLRIFSDIKLRKVLFFTAIAEKILNTKSAIEHSIFKKRNNYLYSSGLKLKIPISERLCWTSSLLYCFNSGKENDFSMRFGFEY